MRHPTIILGAGASHDYISKAEETLGSTRLPLTKNICNRSYLEYLEKRMDDIADSKYIINDVLRKEMKNIFVGGLDTIKILASDLNLSKNGNSLEKKVSGIWEKAKKKNSERRRDAVALSYYLQFLFYFLSKEFGKPNSGNYYRLVLALYDFLNEDSKAELLVVNFNYDLLMDNAMEAIEDLNESGRFRYSKVHGCCSKCWVAKPDSQTDVNGEFSLANPKNRIREYGGSGRSFEEFFRKGEQEYELEKYAKEKNKGRPHIMRPALALPFFQKCEIGFPYFSQDAERIRFHLSQTDGILIIGWSAHDDEMIGLMKREIGDREIPLAIVTKGEESIEEIKNCLSNLSLKNETEFNCATGFSEFMKRNDSSSIEGFLNL